MLGGRAHLWTAAERLAGYRDAMLACGLPPDPALVHLDVQGVEAARKAVRAMLELPEPPTALFTAQNLLTVGAAQALQETGQRKVAVVGFDDFPLADLLDPAITVIAQDVAEIGRRAAELLFARISGSTDPAELVTTSPRLIARGSGELPEAP